MNIVYYVTVGCIWSLWLEYFTTKYLEGEYGKDWNWPERLFHIVLFPISLAVFIVSALKNK